MAPNPLSPVIGALLRKHLLCTERDYLGFLIADACAVVLQNRAVLIDELNTVRQKTDPIGFVLTDAAWQR